MPIYIYIYMYNIYSCMGETGLGKLQFFKSQPITKRKPLLSQNVDTKRKSYQDCINCFRGVPRNKKSTSTLSILH